MLDEGKSREWSPSLPLRAPGIFLPVITFSGGRIPEILEAQRNPHFCSSEKFRFYSLSCRENPKNLEFLPDAKENQSDLRDVLKDLLVLAKISGFGSDGIPALEILVPTGGEGRRSRIPEFPDSQGTHCRVCSRLA